jgi:hypothetical protein
VLDIFEQLRILPISLLFAFYAQPAPTTRHPESHLLTRCKNGCWLRNAETLIIASGAVSDLCRTLLLHTSQAIKPCLDIIHEALSKRSNMNCSSTRARASGGLQNPLGMRSVVAHACGLICWKLPLQKRTVKAKSCDIKYRI